MAAAPWIREALKTTNERAKYFEGQVAELTERCDALTKANAAAQSKLVEQTDAFFVCCNCFCIASCKPRRAIGLK